MVGAVLLTDNDISCIRCSVSCLTSRLINKQSCIINTYRISRSMWKQKQKQIAAILLSMNNKIIYLTNSVMFYSLTSSQHFTTWPSITETEHCRSAHQNQKYNNGSDKYNPLSIIMRLVMKILLTRDISSLFNMFYWEFFDYEQYPKCVINTYGWDTPKVWYLVMNGISYQWSGFEDYQSSTINHL